MGHLAQHTVFVAKPHLRRNTILLLLGLAAASFTVVFAIPYYFGGGEAFDSYTKTGRLTWLLAHISSAVIALLLGPIQLWMGMKGQTSQVHRTLGKLYVGAIAFSAMTAYYLAYTTQVNWIFGLGLAGLASAWIVTTTLAVLAIRYRKIEQHKEWMIRSYVVTFGFVFFRMFVGATEAADVGTAFERLTAASWICWSVPLLLTEAILQGKKIFGV